MANAEIRKAARGAMVPLWKIAERLGVCEMTITRRLRTELPDEEKTRILSIIDDLKQEAE